MSSSPLSKDEKFIQRFKEVCGSDKPKVIADSLGISYQATRNYLKGRRPDSNTLLTIADKTPYSIHWLMTGLGEKFVNQSDINDSEFVIGKFQGIVNKEFLTMLCDLVDEYRLKNEHTSVRSPKQVTLTSDKIRKQKVEEQKNEFSEPSN